VFVCVCVCRLVTWYEMNPVHTVCVYLVIVGVHTSHAVCVCVCVCVCAD